MKKLNYLSFLFLTTLLFISCGEAEEKNETIDITEDTEMTDQQAEWDDDVTLTQAERDALMPADVVAEFQGGNLRFINDSLTPRNRQARREATGSAQYPTGMVLSCIDSRVPVEEIFDQGLGDIFVGRIAGNFADEGMLGSMEFAMKVAGSKVLVVMGHESCGAVKSAIAGVELGNITGMLDHIEPAIEMTDENFSEDLRSVDNEEYVLAVIKNNVLHTIDEIKEDSPILAEMVEDEEIKIVGAYYDVDTGAVEWLE
ncbi:carbonic anhydrase family protein [Salinimicrobium terrae]|uniref:carbonic anhydrase family protein n=1 Tax=Salinimicrobium terrae TaxID=470866 RepID=UPI00042000C9|nr:carbonic anhydrase family protein [Salinimicrobium terrae]